jgi:hypothetical protein
VMPSTRVLTGMLYFVGRICPLVVDKGLSYASGVRMPYFVGRICPLVVDKKDLQN